MPEDPRVRNEALTLVDGGYEVCVVCPNSRQQPWYECYNRVHLYRYPAPPDFGGIFGYAVEYTYSLAVAFVYAGYIFFRRGFDVIHVHSPPDLNCFAAILFKAFASKKFVLDTHDLSPELYDAQTRGRPSSVIRAALKWLERVAVRSADLLIATNESQKRIHVERCGVDPESYCVVRNGPTEQFLRNDILPANEIHDESLQLIGFVGIIGVQDGVEFLVRALSEIKHRHRRNDFLGVIVGDGRAKQELEELTVELGLSKQVRFTGQVEYSKVPSYIAAFDICVTPDPSNPYNDSCTTIKTMEYMALGKPIVAFETAENRRTAKDAALFAPNNDISLLADRIVELMNDEELRKELGQRGRERATKHLVWEKQEFHFAPRVW